MPADQFLQLRPGVPGLQYRPGVDISTGATEAGRLAALDDGGILHPSLLGSVLRQNITGAASVDISGRAAAELTLTGPVTTLTFTGWRAATDVRQEVRVRLIQDATGGRTADWGAFQGTWVEAPPATLPAAANGTSLQFRAVTTDGGTTVWLEPIGVSYHAGCIAQVGRAVAIPAVTAGGTAQITHNYNLLLTVELSDLVTGRRVVPDWRFATPGDFTSPAIIDFAAAHPAGTYTALISGMPPQACELTAEVSTIDGGTPTMRLVPLAVTATNTAGLTLTHNGAAADVQVDWGDGTIVNAPSNTNVTHTYASAYTGNITIRHRPTVSITGISDSDAPGWAFDVLALAGLPLTSINLQRGAITGQLANVPRTVTFMILGGGTTIDGPYSDLPPNAVVVSLQGVNTTHGDAATVPRSVRNLTLYGHSNLSGVSADLPSQVDNLQLIGDSTIEITATTLPSALNRLVLDSPVTWIGDLASIPAGVNHLGISAKTLGTVAVSAYTPPADLHRCWVIPNTPLGAAAVDLILNAIDALGTTNPGQYSPAINLASGNAAPTAASATARTNLAARTWTVVTN